MLDKLNKSNPLNWFFLYTIYFIFCVKSNFKWSLVTRKYLNSVIKNERKIIRAAIPFMSKILSLIYHIIPQIKMKFSYLKHVELRNEEETILLQVTSASWSLMWNNDQFMLQKDHTFHKAFLQLCIELKTRKIFHNGSM